MYTFIDQKYLVLLSYKVIIAVVTKSLVWEIFFAKMHSKQMSQSELTWENNCQHKICVAGNRTRINCLEGSYAKNHINTNNELWIILLSTVQ